MSYYINILKIIFDTRQQIDFFLNLSISVDNKCKWQILSLIYPYTSPELPPTYIYTELAPKLTATASVAAVGRALV